jgi:hypothetical protein
MSGDGTDHEPHSLIAECADCSWEFQEHDYKTYRLDETESRRKVSGVQVGDHSRITGHAVRFVHTGNEKTATEGKTE